jgi:2,4-dienoyl-CoA reductase-like NADH-dependent reductase (Old Yellow Enzyme family)
VSDIFSRVDLGGLQLANRIVMPHAADQLRALQTAEVARVAEYARRAALDGVELHCASGYLPMQFLSGRTLSPRHCAHRARETFYDGRGDDRCGYTNYPTWSDTQ